MWTRLRLSKIALFLSICTVYASGAVIYVDVDATGSNNGSSWTNAFNSLQDGLANAIPGDEIRVAGGTYYPDTGAAITPGDRDASFTLQNKVIVKGGYAGTGEPKPNAYHPELYPTILSGDLLGNDPPLDLSQLYENKNWLNDPNRMDNCYSVVTADHVDANTVLDSVIIVQGQSNGRRGAGLHISHANPTIRNCVFRDHVGTYGGAIYIAGWSDFKEPPLIENCEFTNNFTDRDGPAITMWNEAIVRDCNFHDNCSVFDHECGALYIYKSGGLVEGCQFSNNFGGRKGGAIYQIGEGPKITHCTFTENYARSNGGAIYCKDNEEPSFITHCLFFENRADDNGGAVYCHDIAEFNFSYSRFIANKVYDNGGAVFLENSRGVFNNCLFNTNPGTGMILCDQSRPVFTNCTLTDLTAGGIGIRVTAADSDYDSQSRITFQNCILWHGLKDISFGENTSLSSYYTRYCMTTDSVRHDPATKGIDPLFVDPLGDDGIPGTLDDDLHVSGLSLAIDAGNNEYVPVDLLTDLGGRDRFIDDPLTLDTGIGTPPIVDIGAYEYRLGGDYLPVADAGSSRVEWAWIDGIATIQLDGSGSYDADKDPLTYLWTWPGGSATGVNPVIQLTKGIYTIVLDVSDGLNTSSDSIEIEVLGPWEALLTTSHELLVRDDFRTEDFTVQAYVSEIAGDEIDLQSPMTISKLEGQTVSIPAFDTHIQEETLIDDKIRTTVTGAFDKDSVLAQIPANGGVTMTVTGTLLSDQVFEGTAFFNIEGPIITDLTKPTPNPAQWAPAEPNLVEQPSEPNDPNRIYELTGQPYALLRNPRANNGIGEWYIVMRAASATDPDGGTVLYEFDCFEDDRLDRAPVAGPEGRTYEAGPIDQDDLKRYTFRCRTIGSNGGITDWSYWRWVYQVNDGPDAFNILPEDGWTGAEPPEPEPNAPLPNPMEWAVEEPNLITDPNDPNQAAFLLPGTPQEILLDPRVDNGWAIAMRAAESVSPDGGSVEYQFDCFENNLYDRDWSADRIYTVPGLLEQDLTQYTFRVRARNSNGNVSLWSTWEWIKNE